MIPTRVIPMQNLNESTAPFKEDQDIIDLSNAQEVDKPNFEELKSFINSSHPRKMNGGEYGRCEALQIDTGKHGCLFGETSKKSDIDKYGLAVTLYFRFIKNLSHWFLFFSIFTMIPLAFYIKTYMNVSQDSSSLSASESLMSTTLGALVIDSTQCQYLNTTPTETDSISLYCDNGKLPSSLDSYIYGIVNISQSKITSCTYLDYSYISDSCNDPNTAVLSQLLTPCFGQQSCTVQVDSSIFLSSTTCSQSLTKNTAYMSTICEDQEYELFWTFKKTTVVFIFSVIDAFFVLCFMFFLFRLRNQGKQTDSAITQNSVSASHFTIEIANLPTNMSKFQLQFSLQRHLETMASVAFKQEKFKVHDIQFAEPNRVILLEKKLKDLEIAKARLVLQYCTNYYVTKEARGVRLSALQSVQNSQSLTITEKKQAAKDIEKLQKFEKSIKETNEKLFQSSSKKEEVMAAWVTFETMRMRDLAYSLLYRTPLEKAIDAICCCCVNTSDFRRFEGKMLDAVSAPQPENIKWKNLEFSLFSKILRRTFSFFITLVFLILSKILIKIYLTIILKALIFIVYVKKTNQEFNNKYPPVVCPAKANLKKAHVIKDYESTRPKGLIECYCKTDPFGKISEKFVLSTGEIAELCSDWFNDKVLILVLPFIAVFVIILINTIMQSIFTVLSKLEGHKYLSNEISSRVTKMFFMQFMNTGLIILIMNTKFVEPQSGGFSFLLSGTFADFMPLWFKTVGTTILLTMVFYVITPYVNLLLQQAFVSLRRWYDTKFTSKMEQTRQTTQGNYQNVYLNAQFLIEIRYVQAANIIFVCFLYSSGLPALIITTFLYLISTFYIDKYMMLRRCRNPPNYSRELEKTIKTICWIIIPLHCLLSIWMLGSPNLFPQQEQIGFFDSLTAQVSSYGSKLKSSKNDFSFQELIERAIKSQSIPQLIIFALFFFYILFHFLRKNIFKPFFKVLCCCLTLDQEDLMSKKNILSLIPFYAILSKSDIEKEIASLKRRICETPVQFTSYMEEKLNICQREVSLRKEDKNELAKKLEEKNINCTLVGLYSYDISNNPQFE